LICWTVPVTPPRVTVSPMRICRFEQQNEAGHEVGEDLLQAEAQPDGHRCRQPLHLRPRKSDGPGGAQNTEQHQGVAQQVVTAFREPAPNVIRLSTLSSTAPVDTGPPQSFPQATRQRFQHAAHGDRHDAHPRPRLHTRIVVTSYVARR